MSRVLAIGIDALTVRPALSPRYTVDAPNSRPNRAPMNSPSGLSARRICTRAPGRSLAQCRLSSDTRSAMRGWL